MFGAIGKIIIVPFAYVLRLFYDLTGSYGWALILFTLAVKLILMPFQVKSKKSMMRMSALQSKVNEINQKYANNKDKQNQEVAKLYQEEGINPMSGCLWSFLPLPILIALYSIIREPLTNFMMLAAENVDAIMAKVEAAGHIFTSATTYREIEVAKYVYDHFEMFSEFVEEGLIRLNYQFLNLDLAAIPWNEVNNLKTGGWAVIGLLLIPIISGIFSFLSSFIMQRQQGSASSANSSTKMMNYMMPLMSVYIAFIMPAALGIYWIANSVFTILENVLLHGILKKKMDAEEAEREAKREAARKFRQEEARKQALEARENPAPKKKDGKKADKPQEDKHSTTENGRIGDRRYARGRSFSEDHYN